MLERLRILFRSNAAKKKDEEKPIFFKASYSQEGEDMLLSRIFRDRASGFYVDVGAHHPEKFSNTHYFYLQGWRGISIDATPGSMEGFKLKRPEDINLEFAISDTREKIAFYRFNEPALNTFSTELANEYLKNKNIRIIETIEIETRTLSEILDEYLPDGREFEFLNVDVEGLDLKVLKSNNWSKYMPKVVVVEYLERQSLENLVDSEIVRYMREQDYEFYAKTYNSLFFLDTGYLNRQATVYVLIPVHNRLDATLECLSCLERQTYRDFRVVVVDDGSTDGTHEKIRERYPGVEILRGDGNLWWTGAMHMGVEHILKRAEADDFVLSLNNDTAFGPDFIKSLVKTSEDQCRAIVGSMEKDYYNKDVVLYRGEWLNWEKFAYNVERGPIPDNAICNEHVNVLPGRGMLIPIEVFKKIGNFNKDRFPHYISDYEFTMRAFNAGLKLILSYNSVVYSKADLTGITKVGRLLSLREAWEQFFSRKSALNIFDHINFIRLHCPRQYRYSSVSSLLIGHAIRLIMAPVKVKKIIMPEKKGE